MDRPLHICALSVGGIDLHGLRKGSLVGRLYDAIDDSLQRWLARQPLFFVATAPNAANGHVNLSPKGGVGTFRVLAPRAVAYVDLVGSGVETAAHLQENGRIVLMFCAFSGPPKIVRLHGQGRVLTPDNGEYGSLLPGFALDEETRALARGIVVIDITRIGDSCGFVVPRMELAAPRDQLARWGEQQAAKHGERWKERYVAANNAASLDGLPGYGVSTWVSEEGAEALSSRGRAL
jgi:hypothetical protein